jgi:nitroreductase
MNEVLKNIYARRSVRTYSEQPVEEEQIREIIKAGTHAPTGMNTQPLRFAVISNKAKLKECSDVAKHMFMENLRFGMESATPEHRAKMEGYIRTLSDPNFNLFYDAPVLVLVFAAPNAITPDEDGSLAAENMMLAAASMGIGSCWIGFAKPLGHNPKVMAELGIPMDHKIIAPLIFGHPKNKGMEPSKRDEPLIMKWIY